MSKFIPIYDLESMTEDQRQDYVRALCEHIGVPPELNLVMLAYLDERDGPSRLVGYIKRGGTEIIRNNRGISTRIISEGKEGGSYKVVAEAVERETGRIEQAIGAKWIDGLTGVAHADGIMTAQTRAMRRATLQFVGAGVLDESEVNPNRTIQTTQKFVIAPAPQPTVAPVSAPGQDVTPVATTTIEHKDDAPAEVKHETVAEETDRLRAETIANLNAAVEPKAEPKKRAKRKPIDLGPGPAAPTGTSTVIAGPVSNVVPAPPQLPTMTATAPALGAQAVAPPPVTGTPAELVKPFRTRMFNLNQKLETEGNFQPKEGMGNQAKLQQFASIMFPEVTSFKFMTVEQWEKFMSTLEAKLAAVGPVETAKYIDDTVGA
ncbi:Uncharacterised protein [uncultured archaeon]|nr:Uncharacterised protein [uncultured archaeon]